MSWDSPRFDLCGNHAEWGRVADVPPLQRGARGDLRKDGASVDYFQIPLSPPFLKGEVVSAVGAAHGFIGALDALTQ